MTALAAFILGFGLGLCAAVALAHIAAQLVDDLDDRSTP